MSRITECSEAEYGVGQVEAYRYLNGHGNCCVG